MGLKEGGIMPWLLILGNLWDMLYLQTEAIGTGRILIVYALYHK